MTFGVGLEFDARLRRAIGLASVPDTVSTGEKGCRSLPEL